MTTIQLKRSGGQLGKTLRSTLQVNMDEEELIEKLKAAAPENNPNERDALYHSVTINKKKTFPIDMALLKGNLKKIVSELEDKLQIEGK